MSYPAFRYLLSFLVLACLCSTVLYGQGSVDYYEDSQAYGARAAGEVPIEVLYRYRDEEVIRVKRIVESTTRQRPADKEIRYPWALVYDDTATYFNLRYCREYQNTEVFARGERYGDFALIVIDRNSSRFIRNGGANFGGGLSGVLMSSSGKWGNNWPNGDGEPCKILIIRLDKASDELTGTYRDKLWTLLDRNNFNEMVGTNLSKDQLSNLDLPAIVEVLTSRK